MYDNGKRENRYFAKIKHKELQKKVFTPNWYPAYTYNEYVEEEKRKIEECNLLFSKKLSSENGKQFLEKERKKKESGKKEYCEKYWKRYNFQWKKDLKSNSNRKARRYGSKFCNDSIKYDGNTDDFRKAYKYRFDDIWFYD